MIERFDAYREEDVTELRRCPDGAVEVVLASDHDEAMRLHIAARDAQWDRADRAEAAMKEAINKCSQAEWAVSHYAHVEAENAHLRAQLARGEVELADVIAAALKNLRAENERLRAKVERLWEEAIND